MNSISTYLSADIDSEYGAYLDGQCARRDLVPLMANPYGKGVPENKQWKRGWLIEDKHLRRAA